MASVDTYLRFAEAVYRLEISSSEPTGLPGLVGDITEGGTERKTKGALEAAGEKVVNFFDDVQQTRHEGQAASGNEKDR